MAGSRNDPQYAQYQITTRAKGTSYSLLESDSRKMFTNTAATGSVTYTLPRAKGNGVEYYFLCSVAQTITVAPQATDVIRGQSAGASISLSTVGQTYKLISSVLGYWEILEVGGYAGTYFGKTTFNGQVVIGPPAANPGAIVVGAGGTLLTANSLSCFEVQSAASADCFITGIRPTNAVGAAVAKFSGDGYDSLSARQTYGNFNIAIADNTAGAAYGAATIQTTVNGALNTQIATFDWKTGTRFLAPTTAVNTLTLAPAATHRALVLAAGSTTSYNLECQGGTGAPAAYFVSNQGAGTAAIRCDNTTVALASSAATLGLTRSGGAAAQVGWMIINLDGTVRYIPYWG